jgi:hypothetical protein
MIVDGNYIACQTTITGTFVREFTRSPVGPLPPNGRRVAFELINIFRYDDQAQVAEEWVQTDNRSRLRHSALKAADRQSAMPAHAAPHAASPGSPKRRRGAVTSPA